MGFPYDQVDDATMLDDARGVEADQRPPRCAYCANGFDRHGMMGKFIHVLTRDDQGRIAKFRPCTRS